MGNPAVHSRRHFLTQAGAIAAGAEISVELKFGQAGVPLSVAFDIFRPTGFSAYTLVWEP